MIINDAEVKLHESFYNRMLPKQDGVNYEFHEEKYPMFDLTITKNYYLSGYGDGMKELVISEAIKDLKAITQRLEQLLEKEQDRDILE